MRRPSRSSVANLPTCDQCDTTLREWVETETIKTLDPEELEKIKIKVQRYEGDSGVRHAVVQIEGMYAFSKSVPVEHCSYSRHSHRKGVVVEAACEVLLQLGMKCGSRCVEDFANVIKAVRTQERVTLEENLGAEVEALTAKLESLVGQLGARSRVESLLSRELPAVHRAMAAAYRENRSEVIVPGRRVDPVTGREVPDDKRYVLKGLRLFGGVNVGQAEAALRRARAHVEKRRTMSFGRSTVNELQRERTAISSEVKRIEAFIREADSFWSEENLTVAFFRSYGNSVPNNVTVDGATIVLKKADTWVFGFSSVRKL